MPYMLKLQAWNSIAFPDKPYPLCHKLLRPGILLCLQYKGKRKIRTTLARLTLSESGIQLAPFCIVQFRSHFLKLKKTKVQLSSSFNSCNNYKDHFGNLCYYFLQCSNLG
mmetsp:Transcript_11266/g.14145  ORF Transcript_11266/g.14145 Transcript_11266/m.14145 type:complete len:110 (-) Transcript_11266:311-640(-)